MPHNQRGQWKGRCSKLLDKGFATGSARVKKGWVLLGFAMSNAIPVERLSGPNPAMPLRFAMRFKSHQVREKLKGNNQRVKSSRHFPHFLVLFHTFSEFFLQDFS